MRDRLVEAMARARLARKASHPLADRTREAWGGARLYREEAKAMETWSPALRRRRRYLLLRADGLESLASFLEQEQRRARTEGAA